MNYDSLDEKIINKISDNPGIKFAALFDALRDDCRKVLTGVVANNFRVLDRRLQVLRRFGEIGYDNGWYLTGELLDRQRKARR